MSISKLASEIAAALSILNPDRKKLGSNPQREPDQGDVGKSPDTTDPTTFIAKHKRLPSRL